MAKRTCSIDGCEKSTKGRGLCANHYQTWRRHQGTHLEYANACSVATCERPAISRGFCNGHYQRWSRHGDPEAGAPERVLEIVARFEHYLSCGEAPPHAPELGNCWLWTGSCSQDGYAHMRIDGGTGLVHRWAYKFHVGSIPDGLELDHLCYVHNCVNPWHLEPVTHAENVRRRDNAA